MYKRIVILVTFSLFICSCNKTKEIQNEVDNTTSIDSISYDNALDVPVNKPKVIITIDSLSFFNSKHTNLNKSDFPKNIISKINHVNQNLDIYNLVKKSTSKILDDNHYNYTIINEFKNTDFPKEIITEENVNKLINFDQLKSTYNTDDLMLINVKNGFDHDETDTKKIVAKTYIYIYILNLKDKILKFSESIAGTKYYDAQINELDANKMAIILKESIENTIEIIDTKY